jgi:hypothetical protein
MNINVTDLFIVKNAFLWIEARPLHQDRPLINM